MNFSSKRSVDLLQRVLHFSAVGIAATLIYLMTSILLHATGIFSLVVGNTLAMSLGILVSYIGHHRFTFGLFGNHRFYFARFVFVTITLYFFSAVLIVFLVKDLNVQQPFAAAVVAATYPIASFLMHFIWTFRGSKPKPPIFPTGREPPN